MTLREHFALTKDSFSIDPREDAAVYFGGAALHEQLRDRIEDDFARQRQVPKFCIFAPYGGGKTHTLHNIAYLLRNDLAQDYPTEPFLLDISPLRAKERWRKVHSDIINSIGLDRIRQAVTALLADPGAAQDPVTHLQAKGVLKFGEQAIIASQARVFRALLFGGPMQNAALAWLRGESISGTQAEAIEIETSLTEVSHLVACLLNVAALLKIGLNRRPVLLIDEAEALRTITNPDSENEFLAALRKLSDDENNVLGLIVAFQVEGGMEDAPEMLTDDSVFRRFGYEGAFFDLALLVSEMHDVQKFIIDVLGHLVDQQRAAELIAEHSLDTDPEFFPFTREAIERLAEFIVEQDPKNQVPSQIITRMSDAVVAGWRKSRNDNGTYHLVDDAAIEVALYPTEQA
jgi:hypothetical protein